MIRVTDTSMVSDLTRVSATRISSDPELWIVTGRFGVYSHNQADTAMTIAEIRSATVPSVGDDIRLANLEQELLIPVMPRDPWALLRTLKGAAGAVRSMTDREEFFSEPFNSDYAQVFRVVQETLTRLATFAEDLDVQLEELAEQTSDGTWHEAASGARQAGAFLRMAATGALAAYERTSTAQGVLLRRAGAGNESKPVS